LALLQSGGGHERVSSGRLFRAVLALVDALVQLLTGGNGKNEQRKPTV